MLYVLFLVRSFEVDHTTIKPELTLIMGNMDIILGCLENKNFITRKPKDDDREDKQKPNVRGWVLTMTHRDALITLIDQSLTYSFVLVSFIS